MFSRHFYGAGLMTAVVFPLLVQGCSSDNSLLPDSNVLCCSPSEFTPGATVNVGGNAQATVAVQAVGDFSAIASASVDDLTTACRNIATDLDGQPAANTVARRAEIEAVASKRDRMKQYCSLAVDAIGAASAGVTLNIVAVAPRCEASISAAASCNASCQVSASCQVDASCDVKVTPPKCEGGRLEVACQGECKVKADNQPISCEGSCSATVSGSCTVTTGSVQCAGRCNGTCAVATDSGGNCNGGCTGTCETVAPSANCTGEFKGQCSASCTGGPSVKVKCDGDCQVTAEPISCKGGELKGGCDVKAECEADAKCNANCNASVQAKAECTPPSVTVSVTGAAALRSTLEDNLPRILAFRSRLKGMLNVSGTIAGNVDAVASIKVACIPAVVGAATDAVSDATDAAGASLNVLTSLKIGDAS